MNRGYQHIYTQQTAFSQALGPELFPNPDLDHWTNGLPDDLIVTGKNPPAVDVAQRPGGCWFRSIADDTLPQVSAEILTPGDLYETNLNLVDRFNGNLALGNMAVGANNFVTPGNIRLSGRATTNNLVIQAGTAPTDLTFGPVSVKKAILPPAQETPLNYLSDFFFDVSELPSLYEETFLFYRLPAIGEELQNGFALCIQRRPDGLNWNLLLVRFVSGQRSNLLKIPKIGDVNALRIKLTDDVHEVSTGVDGNWTPRGETADSTFNTATLMNVWYPSSTTPKELILAAA